MHVSHLPFLLLLHLLLVILFLLLTHNYINIVAYASCVEKDRNALLNFKVGLIDDSHHQLSSWENNDVDCCLWDGVRCDNRTNHNRVTELDLSQFAYSLRGNIISPSLLQLDELRHLDLSFIHFNSSQSIPDFIGSLTKLRYLNLGYCSLVGQIPHSLGNLSLLQTLNLTYSDMLYTNHLGWISSLHSLEYLDLRGVNISDGEWLQALNTLPMLKQIYLKDCSLHDALPISPFHVLNSSNSLSILDLSFNHMSLGSSIFPWLLNHSHSLTYINLGYNSWNGTIAEILWKLTHLAYLDLSGNEIQGTISNTIENLTSLVHLDLSFNQLQGDFTHWMTHLWNSTLLEYIDLSWNAFFGSLPNMSRFQYLKELNLGVNQLNGSIEEDNLRLPALETLLLMRNEFTGMIPNLSSCVSLRHLYLSNNKFNGTLTESIGNLFQLQLLFLGSNQLEGIISEAHLFNLSKLLFLYMSFNSNLTISFNPSSTPPFQLESIYLSSCRLGPHFPHWLQNQSILQYLDISNSNIWDTIPNWFWNISDQLIYLNMSRNSIHGTLPPHLSVTNYASVDLSFNLLHGIPPQISNTTLDSFTYGALILFRNKFSGTIVFCNFPNDYHLDLSNNQLSGHISQDCFKNLSVLSYLNLENNNLFGNIEISHANCHLSSLHLRNNNFTGYIPKSLGACHNLSILDLGENKFFGTIPDWLGESLTKLLVLSLKANQLQGSLPSGICHLSRIQVLDISMNELSGTIPKCINNLTMLSSKSIFSSTSSDFQPYTRRENFYESFRVNWKGQNSEYSHTLWLLKAIDFSCNNFSGEIPIEITRLVELVSLNLSRNNLIGSIPHDINRLKQLDVLDLSWNNLSGAIPFTLSQLSLLGTLNLSFNNLSGKIPWVNHLATFDNASYLGNPRLCGPPLVSKPCPGDGGISRKPIFIDWTNKDIFKTRELYISIAFGFIVGFWGAFGTLWFNEPWNIDLIKVFSRIDDWIYMIIRLNGRHLLRYFKIRNE